MTEDGITMEEMCETIVKADFLRKKDGTVPTAKEIFEYSPTGELGKVFMWYQTALEIIKGNGKIVRNIKDVTDEESEPILRALVGDDEEFEAYSRWRKLTKGTDGLWSHERFIKGDYKKPNPRRADAIAP